MSVSIRVLLFASLADRLGVREIALSLADGATTDAAIRALIQEYPELEALRETLAVAVNLDYVSADRVLLDGDEVALIPPVSGG